MTDKEIVKAVRKWLDNPKETDVEMRYIKRACWLAEQHLAAHPEAVAIKDGELRGSGTCLGNAMEIRMNKKGVLIPFDLLDELTDYFQQRADVRDGSDGPRPNREMLLQQRLEQEVTRPEGGLRSSG